MRHSAEIPPPHRSVGVAAVMTAMLAISGFVAVGALPTSAATAVIDLGRLGGDSSWALATDGHFAVGLSSFSKDEGLSSQTHAAYADLSAATPAFRDLGTLGGLSSSLSDVSGGWGVGGANLPDQSSHAVAVNLNSGHPSLVDLGTLGGSFSGASAVSGGTAVGVSATSSGSIHGFAVNLGAKRPTVIDLAPESDCYRSGANSVEGNWVVGSEHEYSDILAPRPGLRGVAWNLASATPATPPSPVALPPLVGLGDTHSNAIAADNGWAVGNSNGMLGDHAVAWNLADPGTPVQLPGLPSPYVHDFARAVSWPWAVGQSDGIPVAWKLDTSPIERFTLGTGGQGTGSAVRDGWAVVMDFYGKEPAFAVDLALDPAVRYLLPSLPDSHGTGAESVAGGWVVGMAWASGGHWDAAAWPLAASVANAADVAVSVKGHVALNGRPYTATVTVSNHGPNTASGVTAAIGTIVNGASLTVSNPIDNVSIDPGTTASETVTVIPNAAMGKTLVIPVSVISTSPDTDPTNNTTTLTTAIRGRRSPSR